MNIHDRSSLLLVPSGYKDGKLYSQVPSSGGGDFTFTRGSNLAATRVGADGLIEKGRENLLLQSNQFDTTWTAANSSVTSGQTGYDGSSDAWLLEATTSSSRIAQNNTTSGVQTFSCYAKAGTANYLAFYNIVSGLSVRAWFNLSDGTIENSLYNIEAKIESVGNGWYRCSITYNETLSNVRIYVAREGGNFNTISGDNIYIQDAQLEAGLAATDYIESGATTAKAGILENQPRLDYSGGATCPSLLLEPSRTQLCPYSEYIEGLGLTDLTATPNATTSPEGLQNAYKVLTGTAGNEQIAYQKTGTSGNTKTQSVYIKADSGVQWIRLVQVRNGFANSASTHFDIQNGVKGSKEENGTTSVVDNATKIEDAGNGWYRLTLVCTDSTNNTNFDTRVRTAIADGSGTRVSNGSYFVWGLQMESDASYPTSYIPNHSGGSVTRAQDIADLNPLDQTYGDETTWFFEIERVPLDSEINQYIAVIINSSTGANNRMSIMSTSSGRMRILISDENGNSDNLYSPNNGFVRGTTIKCAIKVTTTGTSFFIDGASVDTSVGLGVVTGLDRINYIKDSIIKQFIVFPTALSNTDCIALTT